MTPGRESLPIKVWLEEHCGCLSPGPSRANGRTWRELHEVEKEKKVEYTSINVAALNGQACDLVEL